MKPKNHKPYDHLDDLRVDACSTTECTGLILTPAETAEELEAYMEVYDFGPPIVPLEESEQDQNDKIVR